MQLTWQTTEFKLKRLFALTKPRIVALVVFCAVIGMLLAEPGLPDARTALAATAGIWLVAASTANGAIGIIGPIVMTILLLRVSGVAMLERSLRKRKPEYEAYAARTSTFFPRPPRSG